MIFVHSRSGQRAYRSFHLKILFVRVEICGRGFADAGAGVAAAGRAGLRRLEAPPPRRRARAARPRRAARRHLRGDRDGLAAHGYALHAAPRHTMLISAGSHLILTWHRWTRFGYTRKD